MKKLQINLCLIKNIYLFCFCFFVFNTRAQIASYGVSTTNEAYVPITGGTVHGTSSNDITNFFPINIGFNFSFADAGCVNNYTQFVLAPNGFIKMGPTFVANSARPMASTSPGDIIISALG